MNKFLLLLSLAALVVVSSCKKDEDERTHTARERPRLTRFKFDSTQVRLNNLGQPERCRPAMGPSPNFHQMSAHYVSSRLTSGPRRFREVMYHAPETSAGGARPSISARGRAWARAGLPQHPLSDLAPGTTNGCAFRWPIRHDIDLHVNSPISMDLTGRIAAFVASNTTSAHSGEGLAADVNDDKRQGFLG
jgi:hypothetical protein